MSFTTSNLQLKLEAWDTNSYPGTGTTWTDTSGNSRNATLVNGPTWNTDYFSFDGIDTTGDFAHVTNTNGIFNGTTTGYKTYQTWVRFNNFTNAKNFVGCLSTASQYDGWGMETASSGRIAFYSNTNIQKYTYTPNDTFITGKWYLITAVFKISNVVGDIKIYVDDQVVVSNGTHGSNTGYTLQPRLEIGTMLSLSSLAVERTKFFNGDIAASYFYDKALTAQEITNNYNATKEIFYPSGMPLKYWDGNTWATPIDKKQWDGLNWVTFNGKIWDGSAWVNIL